MTVYVDNVYIKASVKNGSATHTSRWCHMTADTREELDVFALRLGLKLQWIQHPGTPLEHYDLTTSKRALAVRLGITEITWREGANHIGVKRELGELL